MKPKVIVIIPFRSNGDQHRFNNLSTVIRHMKTVLGWPIFVSHDDGQDGEPFNRSRAYNNALNIVGAEKYDVYVFLEADMIVSKAQLEVAVLCAYRNPFLAVPFSTYHYHSKETAIKAHNESATHNLLSFTKPEYVMEGKKSNGAVNIVSAHTMSLLGRWDENFKGWGFDDKAMNIAFQKVSGKPTYFTAGVGHHLWHEPAWVAGGRFWGGSEDVSPENQAATLANEARLKRYKQAQTATDIFKLVNE